MNAFGRRLSIAGGLCIAILALSPGRSAGAGFIASNLAEDGTFGSGAYNLAGPKSETRTGYTFAVRFVVLADAPVAFDSALLGLAFRSGTNQLDVSLMTDNNGIPGFALETIRLTDLSTDPSLVVATSTTHPILDPSRTYWLAAVATNTSFFSWMLNGSDESGHLAYRLDTGRGPGPWRKTPGSIDPAFAVSAIPFESPSSFRLMGIGLMTLGGFGAFCHLRNPGH